MQSVKTWCDDYQDNIEVGCRSNKRRRFERDIDSIDRYITTDEESGTEHSGAQRSEGISSRRPSRILMLAVLRLPMVLRR